MALEAQCPLTRSVEDASPPMRQELIDLHPAFLGVPRKITSLWASGAAVARLAQAPLRITLARQNCDNIYYRSRCFGAQSSLTERRGPPVLEVVCEIKRGSRVLPGDLIGVAHQFDVNVSL